MRIIVIITFFSKIYAFFIPAKMLTRNPVTSKISYIASSVLFFEDYRVRFCIANPSCRMMMAFKGKKKGALRYPIIS